MEPGQSRKVKLSSRYLVVAQLTSTLICRSRASGLASPAVFFCATGPLRWIAPVAKRMLSSNVVLALPYGPTRPTVRGPLPPLDMIASLTLKRRASRRGGRLLPKALGGVTRPALSGDARAVGPRLARQMLFCVSESFRRNRACHL